MFEKQYKLKLTKLEVLVLRKSLDTVQYNNSDADVQKALLNLKRNVERLYQKIASAQK